MSNRIHATSAIRALNPMPLGRPAAFAAAVGALLAFAGPASAACVNGYRIMGDNILLRCDDGAGTVAADAVAPRARPTLAEPLTTGSISPRPSRRMIVDQKDCRPGRYWIMEWGTNDGTVPLAC